MENLNKKWVAFTIIGIIVSPILISVFCNLADLNQIKLFNAGENGDWISFWGSMLGSVFGVVGTYLILQIQIRKDNERFEQTQIDNTFFNMLDLFQKVQDDVRTETFIVSIKNSDELLRNFFSGLDVSEETLKRNSKVKVDVFNKIIFEIYNNKKKFLAKQKEIYIQKIFEVHDQALKDAIKREVIEMSENMDNYLNSGGDKRFKRRLLSIKKSVEDNCYSDFHNKASDIKELIENRGYSLNINGQIKIKKTLDMFSELESKKQEYKYVFQEDDILVIVDEILSNYHPNIGNYLRVFHRLVKQIMSSQLGMKKKKEYLGIIRALLSSAELLVVFYNSFYSVRGEGLKAQLNLQDQKGNKTEFFADKFDIQKFDMDKNGKIDLPFFKYKNLMFEKNDLSKIKSLINDN